MRQYDAIDNLSYHETCSETPRRFGSSEAKSVIIFDHHLFFLIR